VPNKDHVLTIVETMQKADQPLILNHIAKRSKLSPQLVDYHLEQLIKKGLVLLAEEEGKKYYLLQPIFYDENWLDALYTMLTPFVDGMSGRIGFEQFDLEISKERVIINILIMFLKRFEGELEATKLFKTSK